MHLLEERAAAKNFAAGVAENTAAGRYHHGYRSLPLYSTIDDGDFTTG